MDYLKRQGARIGVAFGLVLVISLGVWIFDRFDGNSDSAALKPGECFIMTDGPARGSGDTGEIEAPDLTAEEEYPSVDCADWATQDKPWLVYRVEWVKDVNEENGTVVELQDSCPDMVITYGAESVTCLANLEYEAAN